MKIPILEALLFSSLAGCISATDRAARQEIEPFPSRGPALTPREKLYVQRVGDGKETRPLMAARDYVRPKPRLPLTNLMMRVADISGEEPLTPPEFRSPAGARFVRLEF